MSYDDVEVHDDHTISRKHYTPMDPRLGRHVRHDSRSLSYQVTPEDISTLASVRHDRYIPVLDQGQIGSCTGNAGTGNVGTAEFWDEGQTSLSTTDTALNESFAVTLYSEGTAVDDYDGTYPPDDTGCDGLSIAKVLTTHKFINGYTHATSLEAALTALAKQPVIVGIEWRADMFNPASDGRISITGAVQGGHEIVFDELDVENKRVWFTNSWNTSWGVEGRAYLTWDDFSELLKAQGDVTVFTPVNQPAPVPTPAPDPAPACVGDCHRTAFQRFLDEIKRILHLN